MKVRHAILAATVLALLSACAPDSDRNAAIPAPPTTPTAATPMSLRMPALTGNATIGLADFRGKVVLVTFLVSAAETCREDITELNAIQSALTAKGFSVVGIAMDLKPPVYVASDLRSCMPAFPCAVGGRDARQTFTTVKALPTWWILDREGRTVKTFEGAVALDTIRKELGGLLP